MQTYPGIYGPKPEKLLGSVELEIAASVLPQKLFSQKMILALFSGIPFTIYPHFRANLFAVSPPSTPKYDLLNIISLALCKKRVSRSNQPLTFKNKFVINNNSTGIAYTTDFNLSCILSYRQRICIHKFRLACIHRQKLVVAK